ncbi:major facilitator superfamily domain-containing protein [Globomyces pollinis-pini]|nr:major facilitator superfamily domain-containing protein [Globomyces pollinis-pini]
MENQIYSKKLQILYLLSSVIPEAIFEHIIGPLYPYIVRHLLPNEPETNIGFYTGLLGSAVNLPLLVMNLVWGKFSDMYGRKPVLVIGLVGSCIISIWLGLSESYTVTLLSRLASGLFFSNATVAKGMIGDIVRDQKTRTWGYSMYGAVYGISGIVGPFIGGFLSNPTVLYPTVFPKEGFFGRYPYLLTCITAAIISAIGLFITIFLLKENHTEIQLDQENIGLIDLNQQEDLKITNVLEQIDLNDTTMSITIEHINQESNEFDFKSWKTLSPIFLYCTLTLTNQIYFTSLTLFFSAPTSHFGLGMSSKQTALSFTFLSISSISVQLYFFKPLMAYFGSCKKSYQAALICILPMQLAILFLPLLSSHLQLIGIAMMMSLGGMAESLGYLSVMMLITESQHPDNLGLTHGYASTLAALAKTFGPGLSGFMWQYGVRIGWPWLVFFMASSVALIGIIAAD